MDDRADSQLCDRCERLDDWRRLIEVVQAGVGAALRFRTGDSSTSATGVPLPADPFRQRQTVAV